MNKDLYIEFLENLVQKQRVTPAQPKELKKRKDRRHHKWTDAEKLQMMIWRDEGLTMSEIARRLNLRTSQVENMVYTLEKRAQ